MPSNKAFTLMELVFVAVIIGILAAVLVPRMQSSRLREAADQVVSHIRYTQYLAMMDDKFEPNNAEWFKERWQIQFMNHASVKGDNARYWSYVIYSDTSFGHAGDPQPYEIARNPMNPDKRLTGGTSAYAGDIKYGTPNATNEMNLGKEYGIIDVVFSNTCSNGIPPNNSKRIAFDYLGRPLKGNIANMALPYNSAYLIYKQCEITLTSGDGQSAIITIEPETGFARVIPF
jgi:prepilin-type N-terminal cleavage/methylation domain-containing protein